MRRADLIKALNRLKIETGSIVCLGCGHEHNCTTKGCALIREAVKELEAAAPPWIPVEEHEPPLAATVLIRVWDPEAHRMKVSAGYRGLHFYWLAKDPYPVDLDRNIVHWMPLPEPPEEA